MNSDFIDELEALTQRDIADRESRCRLCDTELKADALGIIKRDPSKFVEEVRYNWYDDNRSRRERYRFCSEDHMRAYKSWEHNPECR